MRNSLLKALVATVALLFTMEARPCTNVIISRGASQDGSVLVSYAADSHTLYGELYYRPASDWKPGSTIQIYDWDTNKPLGVIEQVPHTYQTVGNMNEFQVIITETTWGGRPELEDKTGGIDYGSLIYIALQRAKTAREAIDVIVNLANEYGYASEGETFSIADKNEAWIMELIGKGTNMRNGVNTQKGIVWVAMRVPDGAICAHANQARIGNSPSRTLRTASMLRMLSPTPAAKVISRAWTKNSASRRPTARQILAPCAAATPASGAPSTSSRTAGSLSTTRTATPSPVTPTPIWTM